MITTLEPKAAARARQRPAAGRPIQRFDRLTNILDGHEAKFGELGSGMFSPSPAVEHAQN